MRRKVKIGPAFSESVSTEKIQRRRESRSIFNQEVLTFLPLICLIIVTGFFVVRLFYLQVIRSDYYRLLSDENRLMTHIIPAPRGILFDRNGEPLVNNTPAFKILDENQKVQFLEREDALERIANGEEVVSDIQRKYIYEDAFAHVLGYIGQISKEELSQHKFQGYALTDFVGKFGLESQYETILHGKNGRELYEVDAIGEPVRFLGKDAPIAGKNIQTTLDIELQKAVHEAMKEASRGAVIVSDPNDGGILALYSKPSFDPNIFTHNNEYEPKGVYKTVEDVLNDGVSQPLLNRAIAGVYPPGSTYKLVSAMAALETGAMKRNEVVKDTGILTVGEFSYGNWYYLQYGRTDGDVDVIKAIERSNDIYFYKAAEKTGIKNLADWSRKFGMGNKFEIDLAGEQAGTIPDEEWKQKVVGEPWYLGDNFNTGIGQGYVLATPLQVNMFTIPFANGGTLYKPHLVKDQTKAIRSNFMKKENIDAIREGMRRSCHPDGGVAFPLFDFKVNNDNIEIDGQNFTEVDASGSAKMTKVTVGCKTGTSESGGGRMPHAWITVLAPYYDPEIVVTVLVETAGEGSAVAAPIARDILEAYFEKK